MNCCEFLDPHPICARSPPGRPYATNSIERPLWEGGRDSYGRTDLDLNRAAPAISVAPIPAVREVTKPRLLTALYDQHIRLCPFHHDGLLWICTHHNPQYRIARFCRITAASDNVNIVGETRGRASVPLDEYCLQRVTVGWNASNITPCRIAAGLKQHE